jgi:predicted Zn finger-like uncharacterized protein
VVVICPKCKVKLKVDDAKLSSAGSRFKCPKCGTVLVVKKPPVEHTQQQKTLDSTTVLVAHSDPEVLESARTILKDQGYRVITSSEGIDVMVKALREFPFLAVLEVSLPKIFGFEICKKLKSRPETKNMKFILIPSIFDKTKYRREPVSLHGADDYIESQDIPAMLVEKINKLVAMPEEGIEKPGAAKKIPTPSSETSETPDAGTREDAGGTGSKPEFRKPTAPEAAKPADSKTDEAIEKARRLSRTIMGDIYLYNPAKVMESIKNGNFYAVFAAELKEGYKLYESRIPQEIRAKANYFKETIEDFISKKMK